MTGDEMLGGIVLCGGASRRMGRDKACLDLAGRSLLERAVASVRGVAADVRLACGVTPRYAELGLALALDRRADAGPLAGLEAGLSDARAAGHGWAVALACDMPNAGSEVLRALFDEARARALDACFLAGPRGIEPLCGVWRTALVESVSATLDAGARRVLAFAEHATAGALPRIGTLRVADAEGAQDRALNLNTPADLARLARVLAEASA